MNTKLVMRTLAAVTFGAAALAVNPVAYGAKLTIVPALQCPLGCGAVVYTVQLSNAMARDKSNVTIAPQETPGYMYNIRQMDKTYDDAKTKITTFGTEDMVLQIGPKGGQGIIKDSLPEPTKHNYKFLWHIAATAQGRFFVTFDPNIKTVEDMKGKKVAIGLLTQSDWGMSGRITLDTYGLNYDNTKITHVTPAVMTSQLISGTVDVATSGILGDPATNKWAPVGPLVKLIAAAQGSGRKLHYISVSPEMVAKMNKEWGMTLFTATLPPGTLPLQEVPFTMGLNRAYMAVTADFPAETAYTMTKAAIKHGPALKKEGGMWGFFSARGMVAGMNDCNTNPGSIKAFKEAKLWQYRDKGGPPATIPGCN